MERSKCADGGWHGNYTSHALRVDESLISFSSTSSQCRMHLREGGGRLARISVSLVLCKALQERANAHLVAL